MGYDIEKEKREAIEAGRRALNSLRTAKENLNSAKNWGLVDMFGGGFFTTMLKHSKMDQAKRNMEQAKYDLRSFSRELNGHRGDGQDHEGADGQRRGFRERKSHPEGKEHGAASGAAVHLGVPPGHGSGHGHGGQVLPRRRGAHEDEAAPLRQTGLSDLSFIRILSGGGHRAGALEVDS